METTLQHGRNVASKRTLSVENTLQHSPAAMEHGRNVASKRTLSVKNTLQHSPAPMGRGKNSASERGLASHRAAHRKCANVPSTNPLAGFARPVLGQEPRLYTMLAESPPTHCVVICARFEVTTAPPNHGHDTQNAVGYNCDSVRPSILI